MMCDRVVFFFLLGERCCQILANDLREKLKSPQDIKDMNMPNNGLLMQIKRFFTNNNENIQHLEASASPTLLVFVACAVMNGGAVVHSQHINIIFILRWSKRVASVCSYQLAYSYLIWKCDFFCHGPPLSREKPFEVPF